MSTPRQSFYPVIREDIAPSEMALHLRNLYTAINNHDQAIIDVNGKIPTTPSTTTTSSTGSAVDDDSAIIGVTSFNSQTGLISYFASMGEVNNKSGLTTYITQTQDNGALIVLADASPIAVSLNFGVSAPWFTTISNQGAGTATITPTSGLINGAGSMALLAGQFVTIFFDGANWWADAPSGGGASGVSSLNSLTGALNILAGRISQLLRRGRISRLRRREPVGSP